MAQAKTHPQPGPVTLDYLRRLRRKTLWLALLLGLIALLALYAVAMGSYDLSVRTVWDALLGKIQGPEAVVVRNIRLPRVVAAVVTGAGLALSGLAIQTVLRNPLGSPSTLGISQGAAFGASLAIVLFKASLFSITVFAFAGSVGATIVIVSLARLKRLSPEAIILAGVALSALFTSATILMQYLATETELAKVVFWSFGDVARSSWPQIAWLAGVTLLAFLFMLSLRWDLNALATGEEAARGLGVQVGRLRIVTMLVVSLVSALATAFHGIIAFIGLIAPHMAGRLVGDDHYLKVPFSVAIGALLLLAADTLGRLLVGSGAMPVGVISSFLGAPMFLYLLLKGYR